MVIVKSFLLICLALVYPLMPGTLFLGFLKKKKEEYRLAPAYVGGMLLCGLLHSAAAFFGLRLGMSLAAFSKLTAVLAVLFFVLCSLLVMAVKTIRTGLRDMLAGLLRKPGKAEAVFALAFVLVAGIYLLRPFLLEPGHDTAEKVVTMVDTGTLSGWDALTGEAGPVQGNWKQQLENLPVFYACLCRLFLLAPADVLFGVVPYVVLFLTFCVVSMFAKLWFEQESRGCAWAAVLFALITICGNTAYMNTSFGLLHYPYEAMTIFSCVLIPLAFYFAMAKENPLWMLLIIGNAVFAAGIERALVILLLQTLCYVIAWVFSRLFERRGK